MIPQTASGEEKYLLTNVTPEGEQISSQLLKVNFIRYAHLIIPTIRDFNKPFFRTFFFLFQLSKLLKPVVDKLDYTGLPMTSSVVVQVNSMAFKMWQPESFCDDNVNF